MYHQYGHTLNSIQTDIQDISINKIGLSKVDEVNYIEITIDHSLQWESHINNLCTKICPKDFSTKELLRRIKY